MCGRPALACQERVVALGARRASHGAIDPGNHARAVVMRSYGLGTPATHPCRVVEGHSDVFLGNVVEAIFGQGYFRRKAGGAQELWRLAPQDVDDLRAISGAMLGECGVLLERCTFHALAIIQWAYDRSVLRLSMPSQRVASLLA